MKMPTARTIRPGLQSPQDIPGKAYLPETASPSP